MAEVPVDPQPISVGAGAACPAAQGPTSAPESAPRAEPAASSASSTGSAIVDVWSRTQPKYRVRAVLLLAVNLALFCGLCVFTHWLHTARLVDFSWASYIEPARFWGSPSRSLNDFILYPISVEQTPVHGVVLGLLVAAMVAVPIVVSILYRIGCALPFVAAVLIFAHMPGLSCTLLLSCVLASVRPFRMTFRYGSALLAMLPVLFYLFAATRENPEQVGGLPSPTQMSWLAAPWVLAILAACAMMATVLFIAQFVKYRPGAVAPVVAVMFATPVLLFHAKVGMDELAYRVLEAEYGPRAARFESIDPVRDAEDKIRELMHHWTTEASRFAPYRSDFLEVWGGRVEAFKRRVWARLFVEFLADRARAYEACSRFIADHPTSRYVPNVLFIQARAMDTRLDERKLGDNPPRRELYSEFPHAQSETAWAALLSQHPDSPLSLAARLRLAQLHLRHGQVERALELLAGVEAWRSDPAYRGAATQPSAAALLRSAPPESSLEFEPEPYVVEARRLRELIEANRDDPLYGNLPLAQSAALDPRRPGYPQQLLQLCQRYRDGLLFDNLLVRWANALSDREERAARLEACVQLLPEGDALPEAMFRLADLEIQMLSAEDESRRSRGVARMRELVSRYGSSCWGQAASERLQMLEPRPAKPLELSVRP